MFDQVQRVDGILLLLTLNLLMWITPIPFPTTLVAEHLRGGGEATKTVVAVFSGVLFMTSIGFTARAAWITHDERLVHVPPPRQRRWSRARMRFGMGLAALRAGGGPGVRRALRRAGDPDRVVSAGLITVLDEATLDAAGRADTDGSAG